MFPVFCYKKRVVVRRICVVIILVAGSIFIPICKKSRSLEFSEIPKPINFIVQQKAAKSRVVKVTLHCQTTMPNPG